MAAFTSQASKHAPTFVHCGFAVLRTPLLPFETFERWGAIVGAIPVDSTSSTGADRNSEQVAHDSHLDLLREFISDPAFFDAVRIASPSLHQALTSWLEGRGIPDKVRLESSVIRYLSRASHRTTPFGLFAGCSLAVIGETTHLELCGRSQYRRHSRLDMDHVAALCRVVVMDHELRRHFPLCANSSAALLGGRLHYVETRHVGRNREYILTAVEPTPEILDVLSCAADGATYEQLVDVVARAGFERADIDEFLGVLLDTQLLVPTVEPQLTGDEAAAVLADDLERSGHGHDFSDTLRAVIAALKRIDDGGLGCPRESYECALAPLMSLSVTIDPNKVLQVDLFKPSPLLSIGTNVVDELIVAAETLTALSLRVDRMSPFVARFFERYETQEVPLLEALDGEVGIGFPELETSDLIMRRFADSMRQRDSCLGDIRARAARSDAMCYELDDRDVERLRPSPAFPPCDALAILATLVAPSQDHIRRGEFQLVAHNVWGPSGARILGRFAHLDPALGREVAAYLRAEEAAHPDVIFAEIVHLPQGRIGNISARPVLREYEISYLGRGGAPRQLHPSDLAVSIRDGRVLLRSVSLNKEVRPRLSCAHNYLSNRELPVYRFLASLQDHGIAGASTWSWGSHATAAFLPRVTRGKLVLSVAVWHLTKGEITSFTDDPEGVGRHTFAQWRVAAVVPRYVLLADGDNRLPIDCENERSVEALLRLVRGRATVTLEEMYPTPDLLCTRGPEGRFTNEIVLPLVRKSYTASSEGREAREVFSEHAPALVNNAVRRYPPGGEWLYAKLYCGSGSSDFVLRSIVMPLIVLLENDSLIDRWFFVRYSDPHSHIRLRFHGLPEAIPRVFQLVSGACAPAVVNGRISRLVFDTYMPEVERYGGATSMILAESIFHHDSVAALTILSRDPDAHSDIDHERDLLGLAGIDRYFADAKIDIDRRLFILARVLGNPSTDVRRSRSLQYRERRLAVDRVITEARAIADVSWLTECLNRRSTRLVECFSQLRNLEEGNALLTSVEDVIGSFMHMWINRVVPNGNAVEATLNDFLFRHYLSERARA